MASVISLKNVTKMYGTNLGVSDITLDVEKGTIFGFLGPNGAGKTTTINMLVDLIRPSSGNIKIFGLDAQADSLEIRRRIGFLAGDFALDENLTGWQQLEYFGNLRGGASRQKIKTLAERLDCNLGRRIKTLSRGNRQKVGLISALMHDPELLIFDEPTSGLDPLIQAEFNKIIFEHQQKGKTTFISSHILSEIQETCDQVAFVREGKIVVNKPLTEITKGAPKEIRIITKDPQIKSVFRSMKGVHNLKAMGLVTSFTYEGEIHALLTVLAKQKIEDLVIQDADLEEIFIKFYEAQDV